MVYQRLLSAAAAAAALTALAACSSSSGSMPQTGTAPQSLQTRNTEALAASGTSSVLAMLVHEQSIGSAVDPLSRNVNPYGLDVAKISSGKISAGDLIVCDFNDKENVQGTGTSVLALHPVPGSKPVDIATNSTLNGCDALAASPNGAIWLAAFSANDNPIFSSNGALLTTLGQFTWHHPFGQAFVPPVNSISVPAFYVSNAGDGSLVRVYVFPGPRFEFATIATGFPVNHGVPGSILGPSGLNYQPAGDRLYVVDGTNNALYAIDDISKVVAGGIAVHGMTFTGKQASSAHVIYAGAPLNGPISSAILPGGNIAVGNTLDPNGQNLMVEITPSGKVVFVRNVDAGAAGSIFGMVATGTTPATAKLYFNDDNNNTVIELRH